MDTSCRERRKGIIEERDQMTQSCLIILLCWVQISIAIIAQPPPKGPPILQPRLHADRQHSLVF